jgi:hypothetical protein
MKTNEILNKKKLTLLLAATMMVFSGLTLNAKTVKEELDAAKKTKKSVFLVITATGIQSAISMNFAKEAQKKVKGSIVLSMNRDDQTNKDLVRTFGVGTTPVPMIMVIGMNGVATGGLIEKEATVDKLVNMVPSPKKVEALTYIDQKKPVFLVAYKKTFTDRNKVVENCQSVVTSLKGNAAVVEVSLDDPAEKAFLSQVGGDFKSTSTQVLVFNAQGKNTGKFNGITDPNKLKTAALTVPKSCCPSGSTKGCGK